MFKEEMEFKTKNLSHFFTKVLEFLMFVCQQLGFVPTEEEMEDDDTNIEGDEQTEGEERGEEEEEVGRGVAGGVGGGGGGGQPL
jgi:hypothetical protein